MPNITVAVAGETVVVPYTVGPPTGTNIVPFESLPVQSRTAAQANQVATGKQVSFQPGIFEDSDFASNGYMDLFWINMAGRRGSGIDQTIFRMKPLTSTKASQVPAQSTGSTNQLYLTRDGGSNASSLGPQFLSGFTLEGTDQGHMYNGHILYWGGGSTIVDVKITGIPGDNSANPGETFSENLYNSNDVTITRMEIDGRRASDGKMVGSSGMGLNYSHRLVVNNSNFHHGAFGSGVTHYMSSDVTYNDTVFSDHLAGANFELCSGYATFNRCTFKNTPYAHVIMDSDSRGGSIKATFVDPVYDGSKLRVTVHSDYWGKPQMQLISDIKVIRNGVDVTATELLIQRNNVGE
jgi:hypothetical protein